MSDAAFKLTRRRLLAALPALPSVAMAATAAPATGGALPRKAAFDIDGINLNAAYTHPMSNATVQAMRNYLDGRQQNARGKAQNISADRKVPHELFAKMINADVDEVAWVASTMAGENYVVNGLGLGQPGTRGRVVTDAYHFDGSLYMYGELAKQGLDLHVVRPKNNGIDLGDMEAAITPGTTLVAVSLVSTINGFQHDLKALCKIAHAKGALVYADIIQAAGAVPIDVKDSGVDFCACSTYKWLMGDFGVGFLYARKDSLARIRRTIFGYRQISDFDFHVFPYDPPGNNVFDFAASPGTAGRFEVGTLGNAAVAGLGVSMRTLTDIGVERIQAWRQPFLQRLQQEMPRLGFAPMTRLDSTAPLISFAYQDAAKKLRARLDQANINIQLYQHRVRISPSFYNDMGDIDRLLAALA